MADSSHFLQMFRRKIIGKEGGIPRIELRTSRTLSENHTTGPNALWSRFSAALTLCCICIIIVSGMTISANAKNFTIVNECKETIWPAILTHGNSSGGDGFTLKPGQTAFYNAPDGWSGRIWGRTGCSFDKNGDGPCQTGGCGTSLNCSSPGSLPVSIVEFTIGEPDFYDVSLVDGFNLPIVVKPAGGKGNCSAAGCDGDLRKNCPSELAVKADGKVIACRSACDVFNTDEYCCRGTYGDPGTCMPTNYSKTFKHECPAASSYAFDDKTSIITCSGTEYIVTFCSSRNQTACSYHDDKLVCNGSGSLKAFSHSWWGLMLAVPLTLILRVTF